LLAGLLELFRKGEARVRLVENEVTLVDDTLYDLLITVPKYKVWYIILGWVSNGDDVQRFVSVRLADKHDAVWTGNTYLFGANIAAAGVYAFPQHGAFATTSGDEKDMFLDEAQSIHVRWGAGGESAGGDSRVDLWVVEVDKA